MSTREWIILCNIAIAAGMGIRFILGCLLSASRDRKIAKDCIKCREEIQNRAKKLFSAGKGE